MGVTDSLRYEGLLGNVDRQVSPFGAYTALTTDSLGRVTQTARPYDASANEVIEATTYDALDRAVQVLTKAPGDTVKVRQVYGRGGNLDSLTKQSVPDRASTGVIATAYTYDGRRRMLTDRLVAGFTTGFFYDAAGNLTAGGRQPAGREYDALNRMVRKLGSDTARYVFDEVGSLRLAFNPVARVARRYATNGTLLTDSLRIATRRLSERVFDQNVFGTGARYDIAKRRVAFRHPQTVAATVDSQRVAFSTTTGYVDSVTSITGNRFRFEFDLDGRISRLVRRSGATDSVTELSLYDSLARRVRRIQRAGTDTLLSDTVRGAQGDSAGYTALGALKATFTSASGNNELYQVDALAHRWYSQMTQNVQGPSTTTYEANSERVSRVVTGSLVTGVSAETSYVTYAYNGAVSQDLRRTAYGPGMASRQLKVIVNSYDAERRQIGRAHV